MNSPVDDMWSHAWQDVNFGYMHEDPAVERSLALPGGISLCVLSGGDITYTLAAMGQDVTSVDVNPAQIHLHELKKRAAQHWNADEASRLTLHKAFQKIDFHQSLPPETSGFWQQSRFRNRPLATLGRIDQKLRFIARWIAPWILPAGFPLNPNVAHSNPSLFSSRKWNTAWHTLRLGINLAFPAQFKKHLPEDTIYRLKRRFEKCCAEHPANYNPLLARMLARHPSTNTWAYQDSWPQTHAETILVLNSSLTEPSLILGRKFSLVSASNIFDTEPAHALLPFLEQIKSRLLPGGIVIVRSLFRDINDWPDLPTGWLLDQDVLTQTSMLDRAPLCRISLIIRYLG